MNGTTKNLANFLTDHERAVRKRYAEIMRDFQLLDGQMRPWRIYTVLGKRYGMTSQGIYAVVKKHQKAKDNESK